jgi:hypothetical protein
MKHTIPAEPDPVRTVVADLCRRLAVAQPDVACTIEPQPYGWRITVSRLADGVGMRATVLTHERPAR